MKTKNHTTSTKNDQQPRPIRFTSDAIVVARYAAASLSPGEICQALNRHFTGDHGDLHPGDVEQNKGEIGQSGSRVVSTYCSSDGTSFRVVTEWGKAVTTVMIPDED